MRARTTQLSLSISPSSLSKRLASNVRLIEAGIASKLKADALLAGGDYAAALAAYTEALAAAPAGFIDAETTAAAAMPFTAPAKLKGLPPTRRRAVIKKERTNDARPCALALRGIGRPRTRTSRAWCGWNRRCACRVRLVPAGCGGVGAAGRGCHGQRRRVARGRGGGRGGEA